MITDRFELFRQGCEILDPVLLTHDFLRSPEHALDGFRHLASDLDCLAHDFVSGEATALREAAAIEVSHRRESQLRDVARAVGDDRARLQARELFRSGRFDDVVKALEGLFASRLEGCPRPDVQERRLFEFTLRVATVKHPTMKERSSF